MDQLPPWLQYGAAGILLMLGLDLWRLYRSQIQALNERWARQESAEDVLRSKILAEVEATRADIALIRSKLEGRG